MSRLVIAIVAAALGAAGCGAKADGGEEDPRRFLSGTVRVGVVSDQYPGWNSIVNGRPQGFDIALVDSLAEYFGFTPDLVPLSIPDRLGALQRGEVKLVVANFSMTPDRDRVVDFAGPYFVDTQGFFHWSEAKSLTDIRPGTVCTPAGTTAEHKLAELGWQPMVQSSLTACMAQFLRNTKSAMAVSTDSSILTAYAASRHLPAPKPIQLSIEKYGVGLPNGRPKLCAAVTKAVQLFLANEWETNFQTHLNAVDPAGKRPGATRECP